MGITRQSDDEIIHTLQACGEGAVRSQIVYQKPGEDWVTDRCVEPYQFTHAATSLIVLCWQCDPELEAPSWRNFRVDRIVKASATTDIFSPRQKITLHTGEVTRFAFNDGAIKSTATKVQTPAQIYTEKLHNALAELDLSPNDKIILTEMAKALKTDQVRAVHGRFYGEAIAEICADGRVTQAEIDLLTAVRVWLNELGWSP